MTTSLATSELVNPIPGERIPPGTLGYFRTRNRYRAHSVLLDEFERSGITQKELATRLGKGTDVICRWLGAPGNYGVDTLSDLLFAISGAAFRYSLDHPLDEPARNATQPDWLVPQDSEPLQIPHAGMLTSSNAALTMTLNKDLFGRGFK